MHVHCACASRRCQVRFGAEVPAGLQLLADARMVLSKLKTKTKFTVSKCLRKHPHLLSSSQFKSRHAMKFLQPYGTQTDLFKSLVVPGPRLVLLRREGGEVLGHQLVQHLNNRFYHHRQILNHLNILQQVTIGP